MLAPRLILLVGILVVACQQPDAPPSDALPEPSASPTAAAPSEAVPIPDYVVLPRLYELMLGIEEDMAGLNAGLWREDYAAIARHAEGIATHPPVPEPEAQTIGRVLGDAMQAFGTMDTNVHDLAVEIGELAGQENLAAIVDCVTALDRGCVACHSQFRGRLRAELREPTP